MKELQFQINDTILTHSPDGWDSTMLEIDRSPKFLGIVRSFTVQLKFVLEGAELLRSIFYNRLQSETKLTIRKLHPITLQYETVYTGVFDFSSFVDSEYNVTITVTDLTLSNIIKKNMDTSYLILFLSHLVFYVPSNTGGLEKPVQAIKFSTFLELIFDKVTEGRYTSGEFGLDMSRLTAYENILDPVFITNAMGLIGARFDRVEISFADFMKLIYVLYDMVMVLDVVDGKDTMRLCYTYEAFPAVASTPISNLSQIKLSVAKDFIYDTIKVGHQEQTYDTETDTTLEIGTTSNFLNSSGFISKQELDLQTPFRADTIGINEYLALYGEVLDSVDYTTFLVHVNHKTITGIDWAAEYGYVGATNPPTNHNQFNTFISPKRLLELHENFINSTYFGNSTEIEFVSAPMNVPQLYTKDPVFEAVKLEGSGLTRLTNPLFIPIYIEFEGTLPDGIDLASFYNPENSLLSFDYKGETYTAYIVNIKTNLYGKNKSTFKLLSSATNDLSKLIR